MNSNKRIYGKLSDIPAKVINADIDAILPISSVSPKMLQKKITEKVITEVKEAIELGRCNNMNKKNFRIMYKAFMNSDKCNKIGVCIQKEGFEGIETIYNPRCNFEKMYEYYDNTYDDNMVHKYSKVKIQIIDITL